MSDLQVTEPLEPDWNVVQNKWAARHQQPPEVLYHYTTASGLVGMLSSGRLWATNARFLNDPTEIQYAAKVVRNLLAKASELYDKKVAEMDAGKNIVQQIANRLLLSGEIKKWSADIMKILQDDENVYIACFCEKGDLLSQWRGYGATGSGYAVGFRSGAIQHLSPDAALNRILLRKVIYDQDEQGQIVQEWLDGIYGAELLWRKTYDDWLNTSGSSSKGFKGFIESFSPDSQVRRGFKLLVSSSKERFQKADQYFKRFLIECLICFKDPHYHEEDEWRAIQFGDANLDVYFRDSNGRIIPYCKLDITHAGQPSGKLPIRTVLYGPTLEHAETSLALRMLLQRSGYADVQVEPSKIRFRTR
jgi:hypothetical protein